MTNPAPREELAYKFFRENVPYLTEEHARKVFDEDRSLTARAFKAGYDTLAKDLEVAKEKVAAYDRWLTGGVYFTSEEYKKEVESKKVLEDKIAALERQIALERARCEHALEQSFEYAETINKMIDERSVLKAEIACHKNPQSELTFLSNVQKQNTSLRELVRELRDALYEANEHTSSNLENMQHYFENKCIPTMDELNQVVMADSQLRIAIGRADNLLKEGES